MSKKYFYKLTFTYGDLLGYAVTLVIFGISKYGSVIITNDGAFV